MAASSSKKAALSSLQRIMMKTDNQLASKVLKVGAQKAREDIFGHLPQLNIQSGHKKAKKALTGPYLARYYPESINEYARKVMPGWETEQEEYRRTKLTQRRRKGKGPPKKGDGSRAKKKKR